MIRKIIKIDEERCNGCGLCARACHEGAIEMVQGRAKLVREDYCDGLGDCLPACPMDAISFELREAAAYDASAVEAAKKAKRVFVGSISEDISRENSPAGAESSLANFPVQIRLISPNASFLEGADLLIAADCAAYAYCNFHSDYMKGRATLIGCPKLDPVDYREKLTEIFRENGISSVTVARMTVPCCGGLSYAVERAVQDCGKEIPLQVITIRPDGHTI